MPRSISAVKAFIASGRLIVMIAMRSRFSYEASSAEVCKARGSIRLRRSRAQPGAAELRQRHLGGHGVEDDLDRHADRELVGRAVDDLGSRSARPPPSRPRRARRARRLGKAGMHRRGAATVQVKTVPAAARSRPLPVRTSRTPRRSRAARAARCRTSCSAGSAARPAGTSRRTRCVRPGGASGQRPGSSRHRSRRLSAAGSAMLPSPKSPQPVTTPISASATCARRPRRAAGARPRRCGSCRARAPPRAGRRAC